MNLITPLIASTAAHTLLALILCFVPLFNLLGYEYCFAVTLMAAITSFFLGLRVSHPQSPLSSSIFQATCMSIAQLIPGLLIISLNALRVRNCDFTTGLEFFVFLPIPTALYSATLGLVSGRLFPNTKRKQPFALGAIVLIAPLLSSLWDLYWHPPIFVWDHLWGFFSGSLYDEGIQVERELLVFRGFTLARTVILLATVSLWDSKSTNLLRKALLPLSLIIVLIYIENVAGPALGFGIKRGDIIKELSTTVEVPGLVIHMPAGLHKDRIKSLVEEHQFNLQYLVKRLKLSKDLLYEKPIHSFVYSNSTHKAKWMGGKNTMIAKPWLNEIHIHGTKTPHSVLPHELVHALASQFGSRLLGVSARFEIGVNLTLIEGLAEALTPPRGDVDLNHYAKAMRSLKLAPNLRTLLSPTGFWKQAPQRAYTIAGSFVLYLLEHYGVEKFKSVYASANFKEVYNKPVDLLVSEWEARIDKLSLPDKYKRAAQERFSHSSIFERPCAHVISALRREASMATPTHAIQLQHEITTHLGQTPSSRVELAKAYLKAGETSKFFAISNELLEKNQLPHHQRIQLLELRGNEYWKQGKNESATEAFQTVLDSKLTPNSKRLQWIRLWALKQSKPTEQFIRNFLAGNVPTPAAIVRLKDSIDRIPNDSTPSYLLARQLHRSGAYRDAIEFLEPSLDHPNSEIAAESLRLVANCYWNLSKPHQALEFYERYKQQAPTTGEAARAAIWIEKVKWKFRNELSL